MRTEHIPLSPEAGENFPSEYPRIEAVSSLLQVRLISLAFQEHYGMKPGQASAETRNAFLSAWIKVNTISFRDYIETHPDETIDINDDEALLRFSEKASLLVTPIILH